MNMTTNSIYSIESVKVTKEFADVLIITDHLDNSESRYPLHIVLHPYGEMDFFKGNNESFEVNATLGMSEEAWEVVSEWIANNISDDEVME